MPTLPSGAWLALAFRVSVALVTRGFFQPDEYYQSLEPAHHLVFGYGQLTWEWQTSLPIRSVIYPALNAAVYIPLKVIGFDCGLMLIYGPRLIHGCLAAITDIYIRDLTREVLGVQYVLTASFLSLTSVFHALALSRSLSNSLETSLTTLALASYPWRPSTFSSARMRMCLSVAALTCAVRPTNAILWVPMFAKLAWQARLSGKKLLDVLSNALLIGSIASCLIVIADTLYYGQVTFTPLNFLRTNLTSVSLFYGSNPWHYYLSQGLPILCTTTLPFAVHGLWLLIRTPISDQKSKRQSFETRGAEGTLGGLIIWTITIYSLAGHKEWRFLHPLLPLLHICAAKSLVDVYSTPQQSRRAGTSEVARSSSTTSTSPYRYLPRLALTLHLTLFVLSSIYLVFIHGSAQLAVMYYLRTLPPSGSSNPAALRSVGFLMPCHSTPWQAYLHREDLKDTGRMWAISCEPPLAALYSGQNISEYRDQTDVFFADPLRYLRDRFPDTVDPAYPPSPHPVTLPGQAENTSRAQSWRHEWPSHFVIFGSLLKYQGVSNFLKGQGYEEIWAVRNGWEEDDKRRGGVRVWKHQQ
ncbi:glycosyltransferase family 22 protein [Punctularia strigosozonata HHB-11173 SS5]|uniref:glycosyltransferase family 22 protein n=1 Tax=Punctularia strigosozonata (strain HHB-11173) TaxID=741275 RepID=UPI0004416500|nr:glycosyltransferase family 22 protein [Punctularia strigosozonata HHB-11173 SS5]EIN07166.1 glycosyltransferase family 22 protein [Punctularia strigosozonata HHB-11173 SS5]